MARTRASDIASPTVFINGESAGKAYVTTAAGVMGAGNRFIVLRPFDIVQNGPDCLLQLTRAEQVVAQLLYHRRTNREIGSILAISESTVCTHVQKVLMKLGLTNRLHVENYFLHTAKL